MVRPETNYVVKETEEEEQKRLEAYGRLRYPPRPPRYALPISPYARPTACPVQSWRRGGSAGGLAHPVLNSHLGLPGDWLEAQNSDHDEEDGQGGQVVAPYPGYLLCDAVGSSTRPLVLCCRW